MAIFMVAALACSTDDDSKNSVPDTEGTMSANLTESTGADCDGVGISWYPPNNIHLFSPYRVPDFWSYFSICDVGKVTGLGAIKTIPTSRYTNEANVSSRSMPCEGRLYYCCLLRFLYLTRYKRSNDSNCMEFEKDDENMLISKIIFKFAQ
ncbi:MAG: hypothetical protein LBS69_03975 [Prevotellaceae bacterium]|jgi:hypothetical protein|nr:hypothetical protein [Prevotellaceae bacterium]